MARCAPEPSGLVLGPALFSQVTFDDLQSQASERHLTVLGGFHPANDNCLPPDTRTLILLGPAEPSFWPNFTAAPEWQDGDPDPMDRWSMRVIGAWAEELEAEALFPFGGPPFLPFYTWAVRSGRIHASPIQLLVHDEAGLFVSFRGALALAERIAIPPAPPSPCDSCAAKPCLSACPVEALDGSGYDVPACKTFLGTKEGGACMTRGCAARRACPVSKRYARRDAHSAYHMRMFKG